LALAQDVKLAGRVENNKQGEKQAKQPLLTAKDKF